MFYLCICFICGFGDANSEYMCLFGKKQVSDLFVVLLLSQSSYSHQKYVYSLLCVSDGQGHS